MSELAADVVHSPVYRSLIESIKEEAEAMEAYDERKKIAEEHGQKKIADLYDYVRGEEEHHFKEFRRAATNMYLEREEKRDPDFERKFSAFLKREGFLDNPGNPISKGSSSEVALITVPIVAAGIGALSLAALAIMALTRSPMGQRVHYEDGQYLVKVRYGQWYDLRAFVQPSNPDVVAICSEVGPDSWGLYDWVCQNIDYRQDIGEYWETPSETLAWGEADCEGTAILLCSLLRNFTNAYVVIGGYQGYGHAWCQLNGEILETTYTWARSVPDPNDYQAFCLFNDQEVIELWPGALDEVFSLRRSKATKLRLIAEALGA